MESQQRSTPALNTSGNLPVAQKLTIGAPDGAYAEVMGFQKVMHRAEPETLAAWCPMARGNQWEGSAAS